MNVTNTHRTRPSYNTQSGLTLIEVCFLIILISLLLLPILELAKLEKKSLDITKHYGTPMGLSTALVDYALEHGAYPLPAGPTIPITGNPNSPFAFMPANNSEIAGSVPSSCNRALPASRGATGVLCRPRINLGDPDVYVGAVPVSILGLPPEQGLDQYGHKFMYVVTKSLTVSGTFNNSAGAIYIADQTGATKITNAHFVVLSHGPDGNGSFKQDGTAFPASACPIMASYEYGNAYQCKRNAPWRSGYFRSFFNTAGTQVSNTTYEPAGINHYDDSLSFKTTTAGRLWAPRVTANEEYFTAGQNVGIGYINADEPGGTTPSQKLSLATGNIRATGELKAPKICNVGISRCFKPDDVASAKASSPIYCGSSYGLKSIVYSSGSAGKNCDAYSIRNLPLSSCANGFAGIDSSGNPICAP